MIRVLVAGLGNMGRSHAISYQNNPEFEIVGLVNRTPVDLPEPINRYDIDPDYFAALKKHKPDLVSICTYSDSHAEYAIAAMEQGADVFVEKPLATNIIDAERVVAKAKQTGRKLVVGYILRHHPSWQIFVEEGKKLGGPYVFRLNLNQQSSGSTWATHKSLMETTSPIVDCGVHYVDVMCQIANSKPVQVRGMGARLSNEIAEDMYNYGHFQVLFEDGSLGWYEAGWGPMISETAYFVKDIISPSGSVSIVSKDAGGSDDVDSHTRVGCIKIHDAETDKNGFAKEDRLIDLPDEADHQGLCDREQAFVAKAIRQNLDLSQHMDEAIQSLRICLAADESIRRNAPIDL